MRGATITTPMLTFVFLLQENLVPRPLADCHIALNHTDREPTELAYPSTMSRIWPLVAAGVFAQADISRHRIFLQCRQEVGY